MDLTSSHQKRPSSHDGDPTNAKKSRKAKAKADEEDAEHVCKGKDKSAWVEYEYTVFHTTGTINAKAVGRLSKPDLEVLLPRTLPETEYDQDWSADDETALQSSWQADPYRSDLIGYKDADIGKAFRQALRFFGITPFELISEKYDLVYGENISKIRDKWAPKFSLTLYHLIPHPLWGRDPRLLAIALQYTSILRSRDLRSWKLVRPNEDPFFKIFEEVIKETKGQNLPIYNLHKQVRKRLKQQRTPSIFSLFLTALEEIVEVEARVDTTDKNGPVSVYTISRYDLESVQKALDATAYMGIPSFLPTELIKEHMYNSSTDNPPLGPSALTMYIERALIAVRRHKAKTKNRNKRLGDQQQTDQEQTDTAGASVNSEDAENILRQKDEALQQQLNETKLLKQQLKEKDELLQQQLNETKLLQQQLNEQASSITELEESLRQSNEKISQQMRRSEELRRLRDNHSPDREADSMMLVDTSINDPNTSDPDDSGNGASEPLPASITAEECAALGINQHWHLAPGRLSY
ncbi:hypothetical protein GCG54_00007403 [Colletotrichum gloeosporioides]|uniref:Uncharacterized protein n=1 Tax=Colletotrichum gloeosporioides TaxID=474922 RepID=A0A8H4CPF2_COLGL|nr:uncharacterized protein GCG54_00007403 [Colletotrichum gloeosporioides]KAF3807670.1 hypothetical protein GCG54_00007403 [Colletotrichum gloeosporioides]